MSDLFRTYSWLVCVQLYTFILIKFLLFFSRPPPIGGREIHIGLLGEGGREEEEDEDP